MAYRTSARAQPGDTAVCCVRCGELTSIPFASTRDGDFRCAKCGHEQPVLLDPNEAEVRDLQMKHYWIGSYTELTPFAKELGKDVETSGLDLVVDGIDVKVGLSLNSGAVVGLDHQAMTTGLPPMRFLTEMPEHVDAKARAVVKEVQTGDRAFDDEVYIESEASEADVLTVLSSPAVRGAIRALLRHTSALIVDAKDGVSFSMPRDAGPFDPHGIHQRLLWLRTVAGAPRPLVAEMLPIPARARIPKRIIGWTYPPVILFTIVGLGKWTPLHAEIVFRCVLAGFVLAALMVPVWPRLLRGRSTSHSEIKIWRVATFIYAPLLVVGLLTTYNGAFDRSKQRDVTMDILSVSSSTSDGTTTWVAWTVDEHGESHGHSFATQPRVGQIVRLGWKEGALGWRWESSRPIVLEAPRKP